MTQAQVRAIFGLSIWGAAALIFLAVFFGGGGPASFSQVPTRILIVAIALGLGYAAYSVMLYRTRQTPGDERDEHIAARANGFALTAVLIFVFLTSIILYESYHDAGVLPVGWMWFMAYFTACFGYIVHAVVTLTLHSGMRSDG
jgi:hypothetical protein